jgi:Transposase DDE domain
LTTKIHALVDALGNPANLMLTAGQIHDLACAQDLIENADLEALIADKAYDADALIDGLAEREITPVIPPKANRKTKRDPLPVFALTPAKPLRILIGPEASNAPEQHRRGVRRSGTTAER